MQRIANWVLAALAVLVFVAAIYVVAHNDDPPSAVGTPPQASGLVTSSSSRAPTSAPVSASGSAATPPVIAQPVVAFLGDDWTAGAGASKKSKRFTTIVSKDLGLDERNFGTVGSGYAAGGPYADRISEVAAAHPSVVVVSGGRNDYADSGSASDGARKLFKDLRKALPNAVLIAIAPMWGDSDLPPGLATLSQAVKGAVRAVNGTYLDIADPLHGRPALMADAVDPDDEGYAAITKAVEPRLARVLPH